MTATEEAPVYPPLPKPDALTQFFWDGCNEHKLLIQRCSNCGHHLHPPRIVCRYCLSTDLAPAEMSGRGVIDTFTIPLQPFDRYYVSKVPYVLAVVELAEEKGLKLVTDIVGVEPDDVKVGMAVEVTFEEVAPGVTLPLFKPA
ncbi:MAG TPA: Zn-ribbon domain-containing OB-fold protein [Acidimicrobiales bacterium]